jgi:membrane fusion protein (multidrug efflux system)
MQHPSHTTPQNTADSVHDNRVKRRKLFLALAGTIILVGGGYSAYWTSFVAGRITTDNAYTAVEVAQVTPAVGGIVQGIKVIDTQAVKQGDTLMVIDDTDARLTLAQAEAEYASAIRRVRSMVANDKGLAAQVAARAADAQRALAQQAAAQSDFERATIDLKRREALAGSGSVSGDELTRAQNAYATAHANLEAANAAARQADASRLAADGSRAANAAMIDDSSVEANPQVALARARRDQAKVDLNRTVLRAPISGVVAKRQVDVGQRVQAGVPVLTIVPLQEVHVDANFKEVQLHDIRIGQKAELTSDLNGSKVVYHGTVEGISGGTGSVMSTIPAQNATGNWIKVVQRLPVRIRLDPAELREHPLQLGLSMDVTINSKTD